MKIASLLESFKNKNSFFHYGFLLTALHLSNGIIGYVYQVIMGRILQPADFALLSSVMALFMFLSAPMSAISMLIVRKVSALKAHNNLHFFKSFFLYVCKLLFMISIAILIFSYAGRNYLQAYLKFEAVTPIYLFLSILICGFFTTASLAFMQGLQRFIYLGLFILLGVVFKLVISLILVKIGFGVNGALVGAFLAMLLIYACSIPILFNSLPKQVSHQGFRLKISFFKSSMPVLIAAVTFAGMTQLDMILVNWYFSPEQAGQYAAASVLGKAVLYLPGGLILAFFPIVSERHARGENSFNLFRQAVFATLLVCGSVAVLYWFFGGQIISILYGKNYSGAGDILRWYGITILPLTVVVISEQYLIAKGQVLFAWIFLLILPVEILLIYFWHSELWMILIIMGFFGFILAIIGCVLMWFGASRNGYN